MSSAIINADVSAQFLNVQTDVTNDGLIEASNGGILKVIQRNIHNSAGNIDALTGGEVEVVGGAIENGTVAAIGGTIIVGADGALIGTELSAANGGVFQGDASFFGFPSIVHGSLLQDVIIDADTTYTAGVIPGVGTNTTALRGTINNDGTLSAAHGTFLIDGSVALTGNGRLTFTGGTLGAAADGYGNFFNHSSDPDVLSNFETIDGWGTIGSGFQLINAASAIINADVSGQSLIFVNGNFSNAGLTEATNGGLLKINTGTFDSLGGTLSVDDNSEIEIGNGGIDSPGFIFIDNNATFLGTGVLSGNVRNNGLVDANGGLLESPAAWRVRAP